MVASAHPLASQAGVEVLKQGGNAVDAAVAAAFALGVVEPNASGLGGEGVMVIYLAKTRRAAVIDYRSTAPAAAVPLEITPAVGPASAAVPGTVAGLCLALEQFGRLSLPHVLEPAIHLADLGFAVSSTLAGIILDNFEELSKDESLARVFCPEGLPLEAGDILKNPELAGSLRLIAAGGRDVFYRGEVGERIIAAMKAGGGVMTMDDLAGYRAIVRQPVRGRYRGYSLISAPPPVGGLAVVEILHILERFDLRGLASLGPERVHLMAEAMKRGMTDWRAYVGDPDFIGVPAAELLSRPYIKSRAAEIDRRRVSETVSPGLPDTKESPSTTSLAVADAEGNMVVLTQTISDFFGAKVMPAGTGIILNNEMKNFSAHGPNALAPGKRMRTTISPTIITRRGRAFAALGTPGAARILATMPILISYLIDDEMGIQEAIEAPRFFPAGKILEFEPRFPKETLIALESLGYILKPHEGAFDLYFGGAQGIVIDPKTGMRVGGADPRRDGAVMGTSEVPVPRGKSRAHDIRPGAGVKVQALSEYLPSLAGTPGDTAVYVLEGAKRGGTVFVAGGTHAGEIAGSLTAVLLIERVRVRRGRLVVIPYANNSAASWADPRRPGLPRSFVIETRSGRRTFVIGSRLTNPDHQGEPDPPVEQAPTPEYSADNVSRNLDRHFPGRADGNLTQRIAYAVVSLIKKEQVSLAFDLHEAPPGSRLAMMVVANPKNIELGAEAMLSLETAGLTMKLEESSPSFRGLSHREWGDATGARSFLFETPNPMLSRQSPGDPVGDAEWPLARRVGIHLLTLRAIIEAYNAGAAEDERVLIENLPGADELTKMGLGAFLR